MAGFFWEVEIWGANAFPSLEIFQQWHPATRNHPGQKIIHTFTKNLVGTSSALRLSLKTKSRHPWKYPIVLMWDRRHPEMVQLPSSRGWNPWFPRNFRWQTSTRRQSRVVASVDTDTHSCSIFVSLVNQFWISKYISKSTYSIRTGSKQYLKIQWLDGYTSRTIFHSTHLCRTREYWPIPLSNRHPAMHRSYRWLLWYLNTVNQNVQRFQVV